MPSLGLLNLPRRQQVTSAQAPEVPLFPAFCARPPPPAPARPGLGSTVGRRLVGCTGHTFVPRKPLLLRLFAQGSTVTNGSTLTVVEIYSQEGCGKCTPQTSSGKTILGGGLETLSFWALGPQMPPADF